MKPPAPVRVPVAGTRRAVSRVRWIVPDGHGPSRSCTGSRKDRSMGAPDPRGIPETPAARASGRQAPGLIPGGRGAGSRKNVGFSDTAPRSGGSLASRPPATRGDTAISRLPMGTSRC